jgi:hypothetical protein
MFPEGIDEIRKATRIRNARRYHRAIKVGTDCHTVYSKAIDQISNRDTRVDAYPLHKGRGLSEGIRRVSSRAWSGL